MVAVVSTMQELDSTAPDFSLPDTRLNSEPCNLSELKGKPLLVMFICNHCPFVIHLLPELAELANQSVDQGFHVVAISSNDVESYPQDGPDKMREFAEQHGFNFPYLFDESQEVAKKYGAACTPDFYVYDAEQKLVYRGQMDDSRPGNGKPVTGVDLKVGLKATLTGKPAPVNQRPSMGCNIKWRSGNEPDYF